MKTILAHLFGIAVALAFLYLMGRKIAKDNPNWAFSRFWKRIFK